MWQRVDQCGTTDPATGGGEVGPAQAGALLAAQGEVDPAAERVSVDEQTAQTEIHPCEGEDSRERGRTRPTTPPDDSDDEPVTVGGVGRLAEPVDQPGLGARQGHGGIGSDVVGHVPEHVVLAQTGKDDTGPPRQPRHRDGIGEVAADDDKRRCAPGQPRRRDIVRELCLGAGRGAQPKELVEQVRVGRDKQRSI